MEVLTPWQQMGSLMFNNTAMPYDIFQYAATPATFYPTSQAGKAPVEYGQSTTLDSSDRRRRRSDSTSTSAKDKETIPNMHLVSSASGAQALA